MSEIERQILITLSELKSAVEALKRAPVKPDLQRIFARLDELAGRLPRGTNPDLSHYLHQKSYEKARLLLEGRDAENARGACR